MVAFEHLRRRLHPLQKFGLDGAFRQRNRNEGEQVEAAAWAESIPFSETRDYVKKVLSNAVYYGAMLSGQTPSLKTRLGPTIGPREAGAPVGDRDIP